jgi:cell division septation protein DedD
MARRDAVRSSWLPVLIGLAALALASFLVGALAGFAWREPGLLVAYLTGDTEAVAWSSPVPEGEEGLEALATNGPSPDDVPAQVAAAPPVDSPAPAPPVDSPAPAPEPKPAAEPAPRKAPPAVAAAPPKRSAPAPSIAVQVGAFGERNAADDLRRRLDEAGFRAYLAAGAVAGQPWRVRVGPFASRGEAEQVAARLQRDQKLPTWVLDENVE